MSDQAGLLAAIAAHPAEDTPRLAYADWLQENGNEPRAIFIRLQCEKHTLICDRIKLIDRRSGALTGKIRALTERIITLQNQEWELLRDNPALRETLKEEARRAEHVMVPWISETARLLDGLAKPESYEAIAEYSAMYLGVARNDYTLTGRPAWENEYQGYSNIVWRGFIQGATIGRHPNDGFIAHQDLHKQIEALNESQEPLGTLRIECPLQPLSAEMLAAIHMPYLSYLELQVDGAAAGERFADISHLPNLQTVRSFFINAPFTLTRVQAQRFVQKKMPQLENINLNLNGFERGALDILWQSEIGKHTRIEVTNPGHPVIEEPAQLMELARLRLHNGSIKKQREEAAKRAAEGKAPAHKEAGVEETLAAAAPQDDIAPPDSFLGRLRTTLSGGHSGHGLV